MSDHDQLIAACARWERLYEDTLASWRRLDVTHAMTLAALRERCEEVERWRSIAEDLTDPDDCWFDHHGYCQAHMWFETDPPCPHARAKKLLAGAASVLPGEPQP